MKKITITYWIFTGILAALMAFSGITNAISMPDAVTLIHDQLGYPAYIVPFLGVAKLLGAIAIVVPGFPRLKEWAYAGFIFDVTGATYSMIRVGTPVSQWIFMLLFYALIIVPYILYHKKLNAAGKG